MGKDAEVGFEFLIDPLRLSIHLWVIGGGEGDIVFQKMGKFSSEDRGELGASIGDYPVVEAKLGKDMVEEDLGYVSTGGSFVTGAENYPLQKAMVNNDHNEVVAIRGGEVGDEVHPDLLKGVGAFGQDGG